MKLQLSNGDRENLFSHVVFLLEGLKLPDFSSDSDKSSLRFTSQLGEVECTYHITFYGSLIQIEALGLGEEKEVILSSSLDYLEGLELKGNKIIVNPATIIMGIFSDNEYLSSWVVPYMENWLKEHSDKPNKGHTKNNLSVNVYRITDEGTEKVASSDSGDISFLLDLLGGLVS